MKIEKNLSVMGSAIVVMLSAFVVSMIGFGAQVFAGTSHASGKIDVESTSIVLAKHQMYVKVDGYNHGNAVLTDVRANMQVSQDGSPTWNKELDNITLAPDKPFTLLYPWPKWDNPAPMKYQVQLEMKNSTMDVSTTSSINLSFGEVWKDDMGKEMPMEFIYMVATLIVGGVAILIIKKQRI